MTQTKLDKMLERVRALLAKADDDAATPAEAEAFYGKAQELMTKYAIEEAQLAALAGETRARGEPDTERFEYSTDDRFGPGKRNLLHFLARNNACRAIFEPVRKREQAATLVGFDDDRAFVKLMYTSLLTHALRDAARAYAAEDWVEESKHVYTSHFLVSFAATVNRRLRAAKRSEEASVGESTALVLRSKETLVDDLVRHEFRNLRNARSSIAGSAAGSAAGVRSGRNADLGQARVQPRRALGGDS